VQGTIHVCPLDTGPGADVPVATVFHTSGMHSAISFAAYVAAPEGGRAPLVTGAVDDSNSLVVRVWSVDRGQAKTEQQVRCLDSARIACDSADGPGQAWSVSAHAAAGVVVASYAGRAGRLCTLALGPQSTFTYFAVFGLGRDAMGVRALQVDGTVPVVSAALQAVAIDGAHIERVFLSWPQVKPRRTTADAPEAVSAPVTALAGAAAAPAPALASERSSSSGKHLLVPGGLVAHAASAATAANTASATIALPESTSEVGTPGGQRRRSAGVLLVPGALSAQHSGRLSNGSVPGSATNLTAPAPSRTPPPPESIPSPTGAPTAMVQPADPFETGPADADASSFAMFDAAPPGTTASAAEVSAAVHHLQASAPSKGSSGLDLLQSMFGARPADAATSGAADQPLPAPSQEPSPATRPDASFATEPSTLPRLGTSSRAVEPAPATRPDASRATEPSASALPNASADAAADAAAALASAAVENAVLGKKKRQRKGSKPGEGSTAGVDTTAETPRAGTSTNGQLASSPNVAALEATVQSLSDGVDALRNDVSSLASTVAAQNEEVRHLSLFVLAPRCEEELLAETVCLLVLITCLHRSQVRAAVKRLEKMANATSTQVGQVSGRVTKEVLAGLAKQLETAAPTILGPRVDAAVGDAFTKAFSDAVVPAFERAMRSMFEQARCNALCLLAASNELCVPSALLAPRRS
jgi:hypothetical protein